MGQDLVCFRDKMADLWFEWSCCWRKRLKFNHKSSLDSANSTNWELYMVGLLLNYKAKRLFSQLGILKLLYTPKITVLYWHLWFHDFFNIHGNNQTDSAQKRLQSWKSFFRLIKWFFYSIVPFVTFIFKTVCYQKSGKM